MQAIPAIKLTNWERLTNAPLPLSGASVVQWNDYLFVLPYTGMPLLYHTKSNMWSMLPKSPYTSYNKAPPALTSHKGRIFTMSTKGQVATFDLQFGRWTELNDMNMNLQREHDCILASYNSNLYAIVALGEIDHIVTYGGGQLGFTMSVGTEKKIYSDSSTIYSYDRNSKWTKICEFGQKPLQSAAVVSGTAFVHTGGKMYKAFLEKKIANPPLDQKLSTGQQLPRFMKASQLGGFGGLQINASQELPPEKNTPTEIASPPYEGFTLYAIKDTLFSFGGRDRDNQPTSDVLRYNPDTDTWESAGYMRSARYNVAVTTMQDTTLDVFVLGGSFGSSQYTTTNQEHTQSTVNQGFPSHLFGTPTFTMQPNPAKPTWDNITSILEKSRVN